EDETLQRSPANEDTNNCNTDFIVGTPSPGEVEAAAITEFTELGFFIVIIGLIGLTAIFFVKRRI
ncbi:MAG: hypothetical protein KAS47_07315, partial [Candidatus Heimdallarchaeota archaeon]|nr:hypothetical protein [Candidatus Heimdallarchaeota archaeon]